MGCIDMFKNTAYAVLGILAMEPMSGYDIKKTLNESTQHFWNESPGQIYPALKTALTAGLISAQEENGGRSKITYAITAAGRDVLRQWLNETPAKFTQRNELLLKVFLGSNTDQETILNYLQEHLHQTQAKLRVYQQIEKKIQGYLEDQLDGAKYWYITLRYGIRSLQNSIEWSQESVSFLNNN